MLTERERNKIAINHANISKKEHYDLEFLFDKPSTFLGGKWERMKELQEKFKATHEGELQQFYMARHRQEQTHEKRRDMER